MLSIRKLKTRLPKYKLELTTGIHACIDHVFVNIREFKMTTGSHENVAWKVNSHYFSLYRDYSNSLTLLNARELFWSWMSKEKENLSLIACIAFSSGSPAVTTKKCWTKRDTSAKLLFCLVSQVQKTRLSSSLRVAVFGTSFTERGKQSPAKKLVKLALYGIFLKTQRRNYISPSR